MMLMNLRILAARAGVMMLVKTALFSVVRMALAPRVCRSTTNGKEGDHALCDALRLSGIRTVERRADHGSLRRPSVRPQQ